MKYSFDLEGLTVGDMQALMRAAAGGDMSAFLDVVARCSPIDIFALPMSEVQGLLKQFGDELKLFIKNMRDGADDADMPDAARILRQLFGEQL